MDRRDGLLTGWLPGEPFVVSTGGLAVQDEDPAVLHTMDDALIVAFYSNRNGLRIDGNEDKQIFVTTAQRGAD